MDGVLFIGNLKQAVYLYEQEFNIPQGKMYKIIHDFQDWKDFTLGLISEREFFNICQKRADKYIFNRKRLNELIFGIVKINIELINYIKNVLSKKYIVGIISNNPKEWYLRYIEKCDIKNYIDIVVLSSNEHIRKPDKQLFQIAIKKAKIKPEQTIYVDDRIDRVSGAFEIGINLVEFKNTKSCIEEINLLI